MHTMCQQYGIDVYDWISMQQLGSAMPNASREHGKDCKLPQ